MCNAKSIRRITLKTRKKKIKEKVGLQVKYCAAIHFGAVTQPIYVNIGIGE